MPIYEYKCEDCGHIFEAMQRMSTRGADLVCPECNSAKVKKIISSVSCCGSNSGETGSMSGSGCGFNNVGFG